MSTTDSGGGTHGGARGGDVLAALSVLALLIPQAMAYAMLAGLPPAAGLFCAAAAPLGYALRGSSPYLAVGPVAIICLLVASGLQPLAEPGSARYGELAIVLTMMVASIYLALALARAGFIANFLGHPAIIGFNAAGALVTAASQLKPLCGFPKDVARDATASNPWPALLHVGHASLLTLAFGLATIALLVVMPRLQRRVPAGLLACVAAGLTAWALDLPSRGLPVVGPVPRSLPSFAWPSPGLAELRALLPTALSVAIVGYGSSVAIAKALAVKQRQRIDPNRELWGLALSNAAAALVGPLPASGSLARTVVNMQSGARTRAAGLLAGVGVMVAVFAIGPSFAVLPMAVLAGIVMHGALQLVDLREARAIWRTHRSDAATMVLTFVITLVVGLVEGLAAGLVVALVLFVVRTATPHTAELGRIPGSMVYRNSQRFAVETCPQVGILRLDAPLYFANARFLEDRVHGMLAERPDMVLIAIDCSGIADVDATAVQSLRNLTVSLRERGNDIHLIGPIGPVRDLLMRTGLCDLLGEGNLHRTIIEAAPTLMARISRDFCEMQCKVSAFPDCTLIPRAGAKSADSEAARFSPQI